jgi:hypothetical protein
MRPMSGVMLNRAAHWLRRFAAAGFQQNHCGSIVSSLKSPALTPAQNTSSIRPHTGGLS